MRKIRLIKTDRDYQDVLKKLVIFPSGHENSLFVPRGLRGHARLRSRLKE